MGIEGDAAREGDAFADEAAKHGLRDAALDQALDGAFHERLGRYGVVLDAKVTERDGRNG